MGVWTGPPGRVIHRIVTDRRGQLVHVDVKKLGRIPDGGGWRTLGRAEVRIGPEPRSRGMNYVPERTAALDTWLYTYDHHPHHTAIAGPPISRVNDLPGHYT